MHAFGLHKIAPNHPTTFLHLLYAWRMQCQKRLKERERETHKRITETSETDALKELSMQTLTTLTYLLLPIHVYIFAF